MAFEPVFHSLFGLRNGEKDDHECSAIDNGFLQAVVIYDDAVADSEKTRCPRFPVFPNWPKSLSRRCRVVGVFERAVWIVHLVSGFWPLVSQASAISEMSFWMIFLEVMPCDSAAKLVMTRWLRTAGATASRSSREAM